MKTYKIQNIETKTEYNAIDLVKFICALLVVSIHVSPFGTTDNEILRLFNYGIQNWLSRIAVPLFFASSGFLLYRKSSLDNFSLEQTKLYVIKLTKLYVIWTLIYCPFNIKSILVSEKGIILGILAYCRNIVFAGSYTHLWYFPALIFSVIVISYLLSRKISLRKIVMVALCFYVVGLLAESWFGIIKPLYFNAPKLWFLLKVVKNIIYSTRDGLFEGFLFVGMGATVAFYGFKLPQRKALIGFCISYFFMFIEALGLKYFDFVRAWDMYVFLVPLTWFAFGLIVNCRIPCNSDIFKTLRILSSLIFYIHMWIRCIISKFFTIIIGFNIDKTCFLFILTVSVSIAVAYMIYKISNYKQFNWLRKLYS